MADKKKIKKVKEAEIVEETADIVVTKKDKISLPEKKQVDPTSLIAKGMDQGIDMDKMERLFDLQLRFEQKEAKKAFDDAMAAFQGECPVIEKKTAGGKTKAGEIAYYFASIGDIVNQVKGLISKNGLSYQIKTSINGKVTATCIVKHKLGHQEESSMEVPLGAQTGVMSASQVTAAASTFAKRYAFCNAFGIMTGEADVDEQQPAGEDEGNILDVIAMFDGCSTDEELKTAWKSLTPEQTRNTDIVLHVKKIRNELAKK